MTSAFDKIDRQLDLLFKGFRDVNPKLPSRLFHFTDSQGLIGIFVKQSLWASNADFLNDASEPDYAMRLLKKVVEDVIAALPRDGSVDRALNDLWPWVMQHRKDEGPHLYVFCLSEHDDLLSQWRAYGAQGAGYAIGRASFRSCRSFRWISCDLTP